MNTDPKQEAAASIKEINKLVKGSGRIEQIYLVIDRTVKLAKEIYPESYCISCPLTCCINDLFLPVSFLEWKSIETFLDKKTDENTKNQVRENLAKIQPELFISIETAENEKIKFDASLWKGKSCPLLINNKCSIKPYRPAACRTYGLFLKEENSHELRACDLEGEHWKNETAGKEIYLTPVTEISGTLEHLNLNKPSKLLIVWLQEYFSRPMATEK